MNHVIHYRRIIKVIQSIAPFFSDFYFNPNSEGYLRLQWRSKFSSFIYGVNDLSDGTLRFIALCALFLQPQLPQVLIIDEPELGLHPTAITKLAGMIKSVAEKGTKVIAATQSSDLVNQFLPEDILTIDLVEGSSQFGRLEQQDLQSWMDNYALGELMEEPYH
ncbi:MAG TPA: AAA family ATPase [Saprospiraceae bacterium]|nr:AAA family ATPase [Saprospiraceae bacterium]HMQ81759.1 AAA family ATPase [Saprospiraceae bacterium]